MKEKLNIKEQHKSYTQIKEQHKSYTQILLLEKQIK